MRKLKPKKTLALFFIFILGSGAFGFVLRLVLKNMNSVISGGKFRIYPSLLIQPSTWLTGLFAMALFFGIIWIGGGHMTRRNNVKDLLGKGGKGDDVEGSLKTAVS